MRWLPLLAMLLASVPAAAHDETEKTAAPRVVDLAICLDTSGSMSGLIDSARRKIWAIVNDLALAKPTPRLRVALLTYGNSGHPEGAGWVRVHSDFTEDLDRISQLLFSFKTNGGTELVGRVLQTSLQSLQWQPDKGALKLIVVAGNESADQDKKVSFRDVCREAIARGIMVNSIYCVRNEDVIDTWREIARLSDGHFAAIDQDEGTVDVATPFDEELAALSKSLNSTYVAFGEHGDEGKKQQRVQDANAEGLSGGAAADRAKAKSGRLYRAAWCLVDATRNDEVKLEDVPDSDLPEAMRGMTLDEKKAYLKEQLEKRTGIQKQIAELNVKRQAWIAEELKKRGEKGDKAFDAAVRKALRAQAKAKAYEFED